MLQPPRKTLCKVGFFFHFKIEHVFLSVCLKYHIYECFIDKQECLGILNSVSGVKINFVVCLEICNVCDRLRGILCSA